MNTKITTLALTVLVSLNAFAAGWAPAGDRIRTKWADEVSPSNVLPEYPRPQMVRQDWKNLNGLWNYGITPADAKDIKVEGQILVPFAVESSLSGVGRKVSTDQALWYETTFSVPFRWKGRDILLHFGAVDWQTEVWLNGKKVGEHTGGYTPFTFNITPYLKGSKQTLKVRVYDRTDLVWQPRGKQVSNPRGIWYTPVTGIWQTVWLEPVNRTKITGYCAVSDIDAANMSVEISADALAAGDKVKVDLIEGGVGYSAEKPGTKVLASVFAENGKAVIGVRNMQTWSPDKPYLYGLKISILRKGKVIDTVDGYTAMRKISRVDVKTGDGSTYHRMALNNKALFQFGPLDQGWWPDGLYTAPTDEALKYDIVKTKEWGFNMIRKHIKVEPARWFYWCDALGILVWQDMPCIGDHSLFRHQKGVGDRGVELEKVMRNKWRTDDPSGGTDCQVPQEWKDNYYKEWKEIIESVKNFQCIVVWVPFNEAWGQFDTEKVVEFTRNLDGTRLINESSGGNYRHSGDILDTHHYPCPSMHAYDMDRINVLGEYGGIGYPEKGHLWQPDSNWGYNGVKKSHEEVTATYEEFAEMLKVFTRTGCSAAVYTQTTDVEGEVNGLMTYDRKVIKIDEARVRAANQAVIKSMEK